MHPLDLVKTRTQIQSTTPPVATATAAAGGAAAVESTHYRVARQHCELMKYFTTCVKHHSRHIYPFELHELIH